MIIHPGQHHLLWAERSNPPESMRDFSLTRTAKAKLMKRCPTGDIAREAWIKSEAKYLMVDPVDGVRLESGVKFHIETCLQHNDASLLNQSCAQVRVDNVVCLVGRDGVTWRLSQCNPGL